MEASESPFSAEHFERIDESADEAFYEAPRLVTHIDDGAIAAAGRLYAELLPPDDDVLDLMSSWVSHLPDDFRVRRLVGLGMNAEELAANPRLSSFVVHNLNREPVLPFADEEFGGCIVTVSVQYLTRPVEVFREVRRVLRPGASFIVTFSNRCFPTKAVAVWRALGDRDHAKLVGAYFELSGGWTGLEARDCSPREDGYSDPLYAVLARRAAAEATNQP
ncbi:MAG TPA: methyltransferase domain-containing protein [Dehalococcoidia bacterium]|nr:methyltransferase domain-containing protein [Dehalococcoidia bacterium]